jgi:hypothetical protein|tara:strand:- start:1733 stop:1861 length:129 start_codon:yes stop_codon:yes gene_type:complete
MLSFSQLFADIEMEQEAKIITLFGVATMLGGMALMAVSHYGK